MRTDIKYNGKIADAIIERDFALARELFEQHPEQIEAYTPFGGGTWLHMAARDGAFGLVKYLLKVGLAVNESNRHNSKYTALWSACSGGHYDIAEYLLDHGATMDVSASVRNPLFACIPSYVMDRHPVHGSDTPPENYLKIAKLLLDRGIDSHVSYNTETMDNMDAMAFAEMWGRKDIARLIAERHADGDQETVEKLLIEASKIADGNTAPVPEGEHVAPS